MDLKTVDSGRIELTIENKCSSVLSQCTCGEEGIVSFLDCKMGKSKWYCMDCYKLVTKKSRITTYKLGTGTNTEKKKMLEKKIVSVSGELEGMYMELENLDAKLQTDIV